MEITCDTSVESNFDLDEMIARLEAVDGREAEAGIFGGFAAKKAMWNEYGTSRGIPARPFLRNTQYENERKWANDVGGDVLKVFTGNLSTTALMSQFGSKMADDIQKTIRAGNFVPLAPATVSRKGSSQPLIDTGDMIGAVTHKES